MRKTTAVAWGIGGFSALLLGCGPARPPEAAAAHFVVADVIVSVTNQSTRELQIFVGTAALEHSLGRVPGRSSRSFSLPSGMGDSTGPLHFEARGRGNGVGIRSDTFSVAAGQQVLWAIGASGSGSVTKR